MKTFGFRQKHSGYMLVDALVAATILAVGLIAMAKINGELISGSGHVKAKSEAVNLAEAKMEELRNNIVKVEYTGMATGNDSKTGINTSFTRSWAITDQVGPDRKDITISVNWDDIKGVNNQINLDSIVYWDNPGSSAAATNLVAFNQTGLLDDPTGGGIISDLDPNYDPNQDPNVSSITDNGDGSQVLVFNSGAVKLIDTIQNLEFEAAPGLIKLTGKITLGIDSLNQSYGSNNPFENLRPLTADAGDCLFPLDSNYATPSGTNWWDVDSITGDLSAYFTCYVGSYWYGRLSFVVSDPSASDALVKFADYGNGQHDILCPETYRYVNNAYAIRNSNDYTAINANGIDGALSNQHFMVTGDSSCGYTVSGSLSGTANALNLSATPTADASGCSVTTSEYSCMVPDGWDGTITISTENCGSYSNSYSNVGSNQIQDYTLACPSTIIGVVGAAGGTDLSVNGSTGVSCTGSDSYVCTVPSNWTGTITVSATNCETQNTGYSDLMSSIIENYTLECSEENNSPVNITINGTLDAVGGTNLSVIGSTGAICTGTDNYECTVPSDWTGTITASATDCESQSTSYSDLVANVVANYTLECATENTPPVVIVTSPTEGSTIPRGSAFYVYWTISDTEDTNEMSSEYSSNISITFGGQQSPSLLGGLATNGAVWQQAFNAPNGANKDFWITITVSNNNGNQTSVTINLGT